MQTLFKRETFDNQSAYTSVAPGNLGTVTGTFIQRLRGSRTSAISSPGYSGEIQGVSTTHRWTFNTADKPATCLQFTCGYWIKSFNTDGVNGVYLPIVTDATGGGNNLIKIHIKDSNRAIIIESYGTGGGNETTSKIMPLKQWFWISIVVAKGSPNYTAKVFYRDLSTPWTQIGSTVNANNFNNFLTGVTSGSQKAGSSDSSNNIVALYTAPTLYGLDSINDAVFPTDILDPPTIPLAWYFAGNGSDNNSGLSASLPLQTIGTFNSMSHYCGFLDSDSVVIDSSVTPFDFGSSCLEVCWNNYTIDFLNTTPKIHKDISDVWTQYDAVNYPNIWQTTDGSATDLANIYIWENLVTLDHSVGTSITSVRSTLNSIAGMFWTDGTTIYLHTTDGSNPNTNGKIYSRSRNRKSQNGSAQVGSSAIVIGRYTDISVDTGTIKNLNVPYARTTLCDVSNGNLPGNAYIVHWDTNCTGTHNIQNSNVGYWSKHALGRTCNGPCTINRINITYGPGAYYSGPASQSSDVDFNGTSVIGNSFNYINCIFGPNTLTIGTIGGTVASGSTIWTSHGSIANNFGDSSFVDCIALSVGLLEQGVCCSGTGITLKNCFFGPISMACPVIIDRCTLGYLVPAITPPSGTSAIIKNSIIIPTASLSSHSTSNLSGNVTIQASTIDISKNANTISNGEWARSAALSLIFLNNAIIGSNGSNQSLIANIAASDSITWDYNEISNVNSSAIWAYGFKGSGNLTVSQFRAQGYGTNSRFAGIDSGFSLGINSKTYKRTKSSTVINDIGILDDFTGKIYTHRKMPGAYEYLSSLMQISNLSDIGLGLY